MTGFNYAYVDPKDMSAYNLIEPGEGTFKIIEVTDDAVSKAGNQMMVITYRLWDSRGDTTLFKQYLLKGHDENSNKATATKVYNLLASINHLEHYGHALKSSMLLGQKGKCIIKTQKGENGYADKSVIAKWIAVKNDAPDGEISADTKQLFDDGGDDVPF